MAGSTFDVIVIGAGSSGAVVAARLAEAGAGVLLLEAGGPGDSTSIRVPALIDAQLDGPEDWGYRTVAQPELLGRRIFLSRGRCLGGTSAINAMVYMRGNRGDYDRWRDLGNAGWGYGDVLPLFRRSEGNRQFRAPHHGTDGPLAVSGFPPDAPVHRAFLAAAAEAGLPFNPDVNGAVQEGAGPFQATIGPMGRCSTAVAFLRPAMARPNLTVVTGALATRLLFDRARVTAVSYLRMGLAEQASAGEVILCGGALNSPQLLMLSGIGPARVLAETGIAPLRDLPGVGQNLQDHLQVAVRFQIDQPATVHGLTAAEAAAAVELSLAEGRGPFHTNFCESGAFVRTDPADPWPDVQIHCEGTYAPFYFDGAATDRHGFGLLMNVCRPASRGEVRLHSADPLDRPRIDPRYLSDPADMAASIRGLRVCLAIGAAPAWSPLGTRRTDPAPESGDGDAALAAHIRRVATTIWHPAGTCRMGRDGMAVVDDRLRVHGIDNLRVADASIMPRLVSGNPNAACIMIGERAADLVLGRGAEVA
jgi:choline dehydrogenase